MPDATGRRKVHSVITFEVILTLRSSCAESPVVETELRRASLCVFCCGTVVWTRICLTLGGAEDSKVKTNLCDFKNEVLFRGHVMR